MTQDFASRVPAASRASGSDFLEGLNDAVRQNPIPAALVGVGILWLFAGGRNAVLGSALVGAGRGAQNAGGSVYRGAREVAGRAGDGMHAVTENLGELGAQTADAFRGAATSVGDAVNRSGEFVSHALTGGSREGHAGAGEPGGIADSFRIAQDGLADLFARQPLMLGAVGVAIGAAIAASLPTSRSENSLMGETADAVKDRAGRLWEDSKQRASGLAARGLQEAEAQGLTPEAGADAVRNVVAKVAGFTDKTAGDIVDRTR